MTSYLIFLSLILSTYFVGFFVGREYQRTKDKVDRFDLTDFDYNFAFKDLKEKVETLIDDEQIQKNQKS